MSTYSTKNGKESREMLEKLAGGSLTFGKALNAFRIGENMSLAQMGKILGVSRQYINQLETGESTPSIVQVVKIAQVFQMDEQQLLRLALQDYMTKENLSYKVTLSKSA